MTEIKETPLLVENAAKLHGHLGPFLVIGVRMGELAKRHLQVDDKTNCRLKASIKTPLITPFSCVIDGIQASTSCTVGNRKLKIENSTKEITAHFKLQDSKKTVKISVNPKIAETLICEMSKGANAKHLAAKIARMKEEQLFVLEE
ncbi:MAG: formylmethanofuran dehydrogenase subunit E family protein [Candidatus Bathyarchaeia archaeon]